MSNNDTQPIEITVDWQAVGKALADLALWIQERIINPLLPLLDSMTETINAGYYDAYGMSFENFAALQEYFEGQQYDVEWDDE